MQSYYRALTVAGSDSGGGAGIQVDLKTFAALGCYGMSVITAVTAQNTVAVTGIHPIPPEMVGLQLDAVFSDIGSDAVKIGMLHSSPIIAAVADRLERYRTTGCGAVVLDPVMIAKSGDSLLAAKAIDELKNRLVPLADLLTPNLPEATVLLGREVTRRDQMADACRDLLRLGCRAVYLKGGHLAEGGSPDLLFDGASGRTIELEGERVVTGNCHGTGCTLSAAIAAHLAKGLPLAEAARQAKAWLGQALRAGAGLTLGRGHGPVHHFHRWWRP